MKKFVLTVAILALCASPAAAQIGAVAFYADTQGNSCNITVPTGVPFNVYVVHKTVGATGSQWKFDPASVTGPNPSLISTGNQAGPGAPLVIGAPATGVTIAYQGCITGNIHVWTFSFFTVTGIPNCVYLNIVPDPVEAGGNVLTVDCSFVDQPVDPGEGIMNPDGTCDCVVATEQTSWGKVKALYR